MLNIPPDRDVCTVIVTVDASPDAMFDLVEHARLGVDSLFPECPGFVGGALHVSEDETRLIQYLQWESEAAYADCRDDPRWDTLPSTLRFMDHVAAGRARVDARTFTVVAGSGTA